MRKIDLMKKNLVRDKNNYCPIIVSLDGVVLDGNHRVIAARKAGVKTLKGVVINAKVCEIRIDELQLGWEPEKNSHWIFRFWKWIRKGV